MFIDGFPTSKSEASTVQNNSDGAVQFTVKQIYLKFSILHTQIFDSGINK
jgi:hypothetical protein